MLLAGVGIKNTFPFDPNVNVPLTG